MKTSPVSGIRGVQFAAPSIYTSFRFATANTPTPASNLVLCANRQAPKVRAPVCKQSANRNRRLLRARPGANVSIGRACAGDRSGRNGLDCVYAAAMSGALDDPFIGCV